VKRFINFFKKIYSKLVNEFIYENAIKSNFKKYALLFNLFSLLEKSKNRVCLKNNYFYNTEVDWRFSQKKQGIYAYGKGFRKRKENLLSQYLLKNIKFNDDDIILDVGANNGDFYLCFDKKIQYYAYEPSPEVYSNLEYNVKGQNLHNLAVSNLENKITDFYLSDEFGDSSILEVKNFTKKISVKTTSLDYEIAKIQKKIKLIKIEAEGFEPEVLYGLKKYLSYVEYITIDCGFERGLNSESTLVECSNYLISKNFKMIDFGTPRIVVLFKNLDSKTSSK